MAVVVSRRACPHSVNTMEALIEMQAELESHRLEVQLVPLNPKMRNWTEYGMKRVCVDVPPKWFRKLCQKHTSSRAIRRGKHDTRVRRATILSVLRRLIAGQPTTSKYAAEIRGIAERRAG